MRNGDLVPMVFIVKMVKMQEYHPGRQRSDGMFWTNWFTVTCSQSAQVVAAHFCTQHSWISPANGFFQGLKSIPQRKTHFFGACTWFIRDSETVKLWGFLWWLLTAELFVLSVRKKYTQETFNFLSWNSFLNEGFQMSFFEV